MKYLSALLFLFAFFNVLFAQSALPDHFLDGKSVVLISNAPQARPAISWIDLADEIHPALVEAGGDPVAYYELEDLAISEDVQAGFAEIFNKRLIANVVVLTRKGDGSVELNIGPYTKNRNILPTSGLWNLSGNSLDQLRESLVTLGKGQRTKNLLVIEVPEFPSGATAAANAPRFINRNPLNLDVFKLGIPLSGSSGESGFLNTFRYDLLGKSKELILAEQKTEKEGLESMFSELYPYQIEFLTDPKTDEELIKDRIQFVLMRVEAREADLLQNMGLPVENPELQNRIVVKFYIRFLVRNELYIGPVWDADPDWKVSLENFLKNLK
jgi:hypothetical protein